MQPLPPEAELLKAALSDEYALWKHMRRIAGGHVAIHNGPNFEERKAGLKEIQAASADLEKMVRAILYKYGCPQALIIDVGDRVKKLTVPTAGLLDGYLMNANQFFMRYVHSQKSEQKARELTAFYHLIKDVAEISQNVQLT